MCCLCTAKNWKYCGCVKEWDRWARKREPRHTLEKFLSVVRVRAKHSVCNDISIAYAFGFCYGLCALLLCAHKTNMRDSNPSSIHLNTCTCVRYYIYAAVYIIISHQTSSRYIDSCYPPPHSVYFMWIHHIHTFMLDHQVYTMLSLHSHIHQGTTHEYLRTHSHPHISQLEKSSTFFSVACVCVRLCLCVYVWMHFIQFVC